MNWVNVKDGLPEFTDVYLVTGELIEMEMCTFCVDFGWDDEDYGITHWMPLPELPE